jgi:hypothetical protein
MVSSGGGALRLEEPGTALTSFTKCVHGTGRTERWTCPKFYAFTCYCKVAQKGVNSQVIKVNE